MRRLMALLAGHPLAIEVVLPNLRRQSPEEVLAGLSAGEGIDLEAGRETRTRSIMACVEYSHANLEPALQDLLECLAPFRSAIYIPALSEYVKALAAEPALAGVALDRFDEMLGAVHGLGLLQPHGHEAAARMDYLGVQQRCPCRRGAVAEAGMSRAKPVVGAANSSIEVNTISRITGAWRSARAATAFRRSASARETSRPRSSSDTRTWTIT
jgi:hypothetical protein